MSEGCGVAVGGGLCEIDEVVVYGECCALSET